MDTNPMVQGTDTLTDCLNGTLITMNGNEVILQNDMGNRRVNNAFLPSGYQPVGMKEYGGIIYVAAYNPITNKSQIGSFPSPQKKIDSMGTNGGKKLDLDKFSKDSKPDSYLNIKVLSTDSIMIPLTDKDYLRAGDKFAIYSENIYQFRPDLTNYNNVNPETKKAISPKNEKYTLSVGILNSQNEFVDITKTLCRWRNSEDSLSNSEMIIYDSSYSDVYKFNDGYFISKNFDNSEFIETKNDAQLIKTRQKIAANTYAYKLIGPMYLKATLNHIENFNYNIYGIYDKTSKEATIWIEGYLTYNCPDDGEKEDEKTYPGDENYDTYQEYIPKFSGFDLWAKRSNDNDKPEFIEPTEDDNIQQEESKYNPDTNKYTVKIVKKYEGIKANNGTNIFDYVIGVESGLGEGQEKIYIKNLSVKDSLDLSLFGSGELEVKSWKFFTLNDRLILTCAFNAYPKYGDKFSNLTMKFYDLENETAVPNFALNFPEIYNGKQTTEIYFGTLLNSITYQKTETETETIINPSFESSKIYRITMSYNTLDGTLHEIKDIQSEQGNNKRIYTITASDNDKGYEGTFNTDDSPTRLKSKRWILTTKLFNLFYNDPTITDFCTTENEEFLAKMNVQINTRLFVDNLSDKDVTSVETGSLISSSTPITYGVENTYTIDYHHNSQSEFYIEDSELYKCKIDSGKNNLEFNSLSSSNYDTSFRPNNFPSENWIDIDPSINNKNQYKVTLTFYDKLTSTGSQITNINNIFDTFENHVDEMIPKISQDTQTGPGSIFCGVGLTYNQVRGRGDDEHFLHFIHFNKPRHKMQENEPNNSFDAYDWDDDEIPHDADRLTNNPDVYENDDHWKNGGYKLADYEGEVYSRMNSYCRGYFCTFQTVLWNTYSDNLDGNQHHATDQGYNHPNDWHPYSNGSPICCRIWVKSSTDGYWAYFGHIEYEDIVTAINATQDMCDSVKDALNDKFKDIIYCVYNSGNSLGSGNKPTLYKPGSIRQYNTYYSFQVITTLEYEINNPVEIECYEIGNLQFKFSLAENWNNLELPVELHSYEKFEENILKTLNITELSNLTKNGKMVDSDGNRLDPRCNYKMVDGELKKIPAIFQIGYETTSTGLNIPYCQATKGTPAYRFNLIGNDSTDTHTILDFAGINMVNFSLLNG